MIGHPPTEAKRYKMLRRNVKNPHLEYLVVQLSLPEARRIKLETFFEDCNYVTRYNKEWDSGHKRKAEEVFGRQVTIKGDVPDSVPNATVSVGDADSRAISSLISRRASPVLLIRVLYARHALEVTVTMLATAVRRDLDFLIENLRSARIPKMIGAFLLSEKKTHCHIQAT